MPSMSAGTEEEVNLCFGFSSLSWAFLLSQLTGEVTASQSQAHNLQSQYDAVHFPLWFGL